jgi:hypothetical protein
MGKEVFLEEAKILMKLVEETLEVVDAEEVDEERRRAIEEKVWEAVREWRKRNTMRFYA